MSAFAKYMDMSVNELRDEIFENGLEKEDDEALQRYAEALLVESLCPELTKSQRIVLDERRQQALVAFRQMAKDKAETQIIDDFREEIGI